MPEKVKPLKTESRTTLTSGNGLGSTERSGSWWARRSGLERRLSLLATVLGLMAVGLAVAVLLVAVSSTPSGSYRQAAGRSVAAQDICLTKGCVQAACSILDNMDEQVNPCDDFYEFACGSFIKNTVIPSEKTSVSQFTVVSDALKIKMRKLVESPVVSDEPDSSRHIKNLFVSCREKGREPMAARRVGGLAPALSAPGGRGMAADTASCTDGQPLGVQPPPTAESESLGKPQSSVPLSRQWGSSSNQSRI